MASDQNYILAQYNLGILHLQDGNIDKAIDYLTLSSNKNHSDSAFNLGLIFIDEKYRKENITKGLYYLKHAADDLNCWKSQYNLGIIYYEGKYIQKDIDKSIHYFQLAAKQNHHQSLCSLGTIFSDGKYKPIDITKAISYFQQDVNLYKSSDSCLALGKIYYNFKQDIKTALYYFHLSAEQNNDQAMFIIGQIYTELDDFEKALYYFKLAADHNNANAQHFLGIVYSHKDSGMENMQKAFYYYEKAAKNNFPDSQYEIGKLYLENQIYEKAIYYLNEASKNYYFEASYILGCLYDEGKVVKRNIVKAIHYYKEATSFNHLLAKNNLAIIYINNFDDGTNKNIFYAIELLKEVIKNKKDEKHLISMFNLAHLYIFKYPNKDKINEAIDLLFILSNKFFYPAILLLSLAFVLKYGTNLTVEDILNENDSHEVKIWPLLFGIIICFYKLNDDKIFKEKLESFQNIHFVYDFLGNLNLSSFYMKNDFNRKYVDNIKQIDITADFYEGFGLDLLE